MLKLYGIPQSRALRCLWMLEELGLEYESLPIDFRADCKKPDYLALNPNGKIPTLDDDGFVIWESLAINLYLARKYDGGLWPKSEADQALTIQWSFWAMTTLEPPVIEVFLNRVMLPEAERDATRADAGEAALQQPVGVLDGALAERDYLLGSRFGAADLNVHSVLSTAAILGGCDLSAYPRASRWLAACGARPALQRALGR